MPVFKGAISFARYVAERLKDPPKDARRSLSGALRRGAFEPLDPNEDEDRAVGWVEIQNPDATDLAPGSFLFGEYLLVSYRVDTLRVPAARVKAELDEWARAYEEKNGEPPKRSLKSEEKEHIIKKLKKRAFPISRTYDVSWNQTTDDVAIWCTSRKLLEEIHIAFEETFGVRLLLQSPGAKAEANDIDPSTIEPTPELFGPDVVSEAKNRVGT